MNFSSFGNSSNGAGFFNEQNNFDSPTQNKNKKAPRRAQNVFPVVIRQIHNCNEEDFAIFGINVQMVSIVGILKNQDVQSTKAMYQVEDHTGIITAVLWLENDTNHPPNLPPVKEGNYVRVYGIIRVHDNQKNVMIMKMLPVVDINEVTTHLLEVIHARTEAEALAKRTDLPSAVKANNPGIQFANSINFTNDSTHNDMGLSPFQEKIYKILQATNETIGLSEQQVLEKFPRPQHRDVIEQINFLVMEGHVYSTIDDKHFRATSSF